jgi:hypothetical protein
LAAVARKEPAPGVDISSRVISRLRRESVPSSLPLEVFAAGALALAAVAAITAAQAFGLFSDPLWDLLQTAVVIW